MPPAPGHWRGPGKMSSQAIWLEGLKRALPICLGYLPVGFAFGVLAVKNGLPPGLAVAMSLVQFSGSGQFVFASLWGNGATWLSAAVAVGVINLRYALMSAAEAPWMRGVGFLRRLALGFGVTDENFAVCAAAVKSGWKFDSATVFVTNHTTQLAWVGGTALGAFSGGLIDDVRPLGLDYAITAMFIALLMPLCDKWNRAAVALFSLSLSIALKISGLGQWNVALAAVAGATFGLWLSSGKRRGEKAR